MPECQCVCVCQTDIRKEKQRLVSAFLSCHTTASSDRLSDVHPKTGEALLRTCLCHSCIVQYIVECMCNQPWGVLTCLNYSKQSKMSCRAPFSLAQTQELAWLPTKKKPTWESNSWEQYHLGITVKPICLASGPAAVCSQRAVNI